MKNKRPVLNLELSPLDKILEALALFCVAALIFLPVYFFNSLPETMPVHFNAKGEPDGFGGKSTVWLLPAVGVVMYAGLTFLSRIPHHFNYLVEITEENARAQYTNALKLIRILKTVIMFLFTAITYGMIKTALGEKQGLGSGFLFIFLAAIFGTIGWYLVKTLRK